MVLTCRDQLKTIVFHITDMHQIFYLSLLYISIYTHILELLRRLFFVHSLIMLL